jgi:GNAT superfamily N-acetyltransferase
VVCVSGREPRATPQLVLELDDVIAHWAIASLGPDPRVTLLRAGAAVGTLDPSRPQLDFVNRVSGVREGDARELPALLETYERAGVAPWLELVPQDGYETLARTLHGRRAAQVGFLSLLAGGVAPSPTADLQHVVVDEVRPPMLAAFAETLLGGHEAPPGVWREEREQTFVHWLDDERIRLYLATVEGRPAAAGVLFVDERVGYLANAATVPPLRGLGAQRALLDRRIADARASGCELVSAVASVAGQSQRNLERCGLRVVASRAVWRVQDAGVA